MTRRILNLLSLVIFFGFTTSAHAALLGQASKYNVFTFGDMTVTSDAEGRVATGGNFTATNYSIGLLATPSDYSLVAGGTVTFGPGSIRNGGIFADGSVTIKNYSIDGKVVSNSSVTTINGPPIQMVQNANTTSPIDFAATESYLKGVSASLAGQAANGTTEVFNWGGIKLTGGNGISIFSLNGNALNSAANFGYNLGTDEIAIINVSGTGMDIGPFGFYGANVIPGNILFNFYEAETLNIHNIAFAGSILAPFADVTFNSAHIDGTFIANSLTGSGQYNHFLFEHDLPGGQPVPEPATLFLFGVGLIGLSFAATRSRKNK